ncbi:MAG: hypothetical protein MO852_13525, partial [Candidatus Devosia euplotis]|nr:hypothetical protein [Candidatus Devosia euplotis]
MLVPAFSGFSVDDIAVDIPDPDNIGDRLVVNVGAFDLSLGVTDLDGGFTIDANWDQASNAIAINEVSVTGVNLATIKLAGTVGNATEVLFSNNENMMMGAAMGLP